MEEMMIIGQSGIKLVEKLRLPSVQRSKKRIPNLSQIPLQDTEDFIDKKNASCVIDQQEYLDTSRCLNKIASLKNSDEARASSPGLGIKGIITPTHVRILKPIIKKPNLYLGVAKKRKPLKLLDKLNTQISLKQEIFVSWGELLRTSNGLDVIPMLSGNYKYFIGKGNNGGLVNHILKSRFWWTRVDSPDLANLVWTQLKHKPTLEKLSNSENIENSLPKPLKKPSSAYCQQEKTIGISLISESSYFQARETSQILQSENLSVHNRLANNFCICNKKNLFKNLKEYYEKSGVNPFEKIPLTFHIEKGIEDESFSAFLQNFKENSVWIIKPGEGTNRGNGIKVVNNLQEIKETLGNTSASRTFILQKYIENPLLINRRKFDIRCYALVTCINGTLQAYFYKEGYLRTTSKEYNLKQVHDKFIHLTNDAVQKHSEEYGKFESGNKLSYSDFQKFLSVSYPDKDFQRDIYPYIEKSVKDSIVCVKDVLNCNKKSTTFEVFGYDFMIDNEFNVWLIEVNTNPCLELSCSYLAKIIPEMLENAFKIAIDPVFPPVIEHKKFKNWVEDLNFVNRFSLIFSSVVKLPEIN
jgi:tubulin--tyrosine ligase